MIKYYQVSKAGGERVGAVYATCITKACKAFIERNKLNAAYKLHNTELACIRISGNSGLMSDYVISYSRKMHDSL